MSELEREEDVDEAIKETISRVARIEETRKKLKRSHCQYHY